MSLLNRCTKLYNTRNKKYNANTPLHKDENGTLCCCFASSKLPNHSDLKCLPWATNKSTKSTSPFCSLTHNNQCSIGNAMILIFFCKGMFDTLGKWPTPPPHREKVGKPVHFCPEWHLSPYTFDKSLDYPIPDHTGPSIMPTRYVCPYI